MIVMDFQEFASLLDPSLYDSIQKYRVVDDAMMPEEYRFSNPKGRPYHDDWFFGKKIRRMDCAYRIPLPFKVIGGSFRREFMLFDPSYPLAPGMETKTENGLTYVLTDRGNYGLVTYAAFIDGEWKSCFQRYTGKWFGKRLSWYHGLHQDNTVSIRPDGSIRSDLMCWFPELACSWVKEI
jgi:hypothetical protein